MLNPPYQPDSAASAAWPLAAANPTKPKAPTVLISFMFFSKSARAPYGRLMTTLTSVTEAPRDNTLPFTVNIGRLGGGAVESGAPA